MNAKISVFVNCVKAIIYLLLYGLHDCTFKNLTIKPFDLLNTIPLASTKTLVNNLLMGKF